MNIYIDESGSFVSTRDPDSWCAVAAYVSPESDRKKVESLLRLLALRHNAGSREVKLKHLDEAAYFAFLIELGRLNGIVFSVATDMGYNSPDAVARHQSKQAQGIVAHREKMKHKPARDALTELGNTVREMTPQLYIQLSLQTILFEKVIRLATLYFVQRAPQTLREFRWRMDQKDHVPTAYEKAFRTVLPGLLQSRSFDEPMIFLDGCDYSHMSHYEYPKGQAPDYLHKQYGIPVFDGLNIGKIVAGNFLLLSILTYMLSFGSNSISSHDPR